MNRKQMPLLSENDFKRFQKLSQGEKISVIDGSISIDAQIPNDMFNRLLLEESDSEVLAHLAYVLEQFGDETSVKPLIALMQKTDSSEVCLEVALALYRRHTDEAIGFLRAVAAGSIKTACTEDFLEYLRGLL